MTIISQGNKSIVSGTLLETWNIYSAPSNGNHIVLLEMADGTEEIPSCVSAVILKHQLPQLSHMAIRARQARILFLCCESDHIYQQTLEQAR